MNMRVITGDKDKIYNEINSDSFKTSGGNEISYEISVADVEAVDTYKPADPDVITDKNPFEAKEYKIVTKDGTKIQISILMAVDSLGSQLCQSDICSFLLEGMKKLLPDYFKISNKLDDPL